jgi:hypothetical protein
MSDLAIKYAVVDRHEIGAGTPGTGIVFEEAFQGGTIDGWGANAGFTVEKPEPAKRRERVLRRMNGVLLEVRDDDARVMLAEGGETVEYWLPVAPLRRAGVKLVGQPFEMDEFEELGQQECSIGYRYRPAATAGDVNVESLEFDLERKRKLDAILHGWGHAEN